MKNKGILVVVSGFSGSGKGTIMKSLMNQYGDFYALSVSATTRSPRPGEENGIDYFFVSRDQFKNMIANDQLVEYAQYVGNYYGTPKSYVEEQLNCGKSVILEIEIQGALKIKEKYPETKLLFVTAPSANVLRDRLTGRGTESEQVIAERLNRACEEAQGIENYDYLIINDQLEECVNNVHEILQNEIQCKSSLNESNSINNNETFIKNMRNQLLSFSKGE